MGNKSENRETIQFQNTETPDILNNWLPSLIPGKGQPGPPILSNAVVGLHGLLQRLLVDPDRLRVLQLARSSVPRDILL